MTLETRARKWCFPIAILLAWLGIALTFLSNSPYRGEHWALLYALEHSSGMRESIHSISSFVCFGVVRFQPLAFYLSLVPYLFFKHFYAGQYFFTVLLHFGVAHLFLLFFHQRMKRPGVEIKGLWMSYPLEGLIFLTSLFAADVVSWSFYLYLQVAVLLAFGGVYCFYYREWSVFRVAPILLTSILIYEPMVFVLLVLFERRGKLRENAFVLGLTISVISILFYRYSHHLEAVRTYSRGSSPPILSWSIAAKGVAALMKGGVQALLMVVHLILPIPGEKGSIFEMGLPDFIRENVLFAASAGWLLWTCLFLREKSRRGKWLMLLWPFLFLSIAWARTENSSYPIIQYRYAYVIMIPFFLSLLCWLSAIRFRTLRVGILSVILSVQIVQTVRHWESVSAALLPLSDRVVEIKRDGLSARQITDWVNGLIISGEGFPGASLPFLTNAGSCSLQWQLWLSAS